MPTTPTYPGVYIEEVPGGVRTIVGVATSITAFVGRALRGPLNDPVRIQSFADFERAFGGLWVDSTSGYAVQHFFLNGGTDAIIVRVHRPSVNTNDDTATITLPAAGGGNLILESANPGSWGENLRASVNHTTRDADLPPAERDQNLFNLTIEETVPGTDPPVIGASETFLNVSRDANSPRFVGSVLAQESNLVRVRGNMPAGRPNSTANAQGQDTPVGANGGSNGRAVRDDEISDPSLQTDKKGIFALERADLFNLLCIPPLTRDTDIGSTTREAALKLCADHRAMFIVDPPSNWNEARDVTDQTIGLNSLNLPYKKNGAIYFPRMKMPDPERENRLEEFVPCGVVAGVMARTDGQRGVWKAPAGQEATLVGVRELSVKLTDGENGQLNPLGVNCLRTFPIVGNVVWGARTVDGADRLASEWKYVPVRRTALYLEETLYRNLQWVVFEPNDEPLWAQIRLNVGAFMQDLFRQGAFQGSSPREAYLVKCDKDTTTQNDINRGVVNILVGFAPLKPAEFVVVKIQQMAGRVQT